MFQRRISVKSILVPLDFSRTAMQELDYATALAKQLNAQIHLVHVQIPDEACVVPEAGHLMRECAESVTFLHEKLAGYSSRTTAAVFWPENCHVRTGRAYEEICNLAQELKVDLIVLASRGNTGLEKNRARQHGRAGCPLLTLSGPGRASAKTERKLSILDW